MTKKINNTIQPGVGESIYLNRKPFLSNPKKLTKEDSYIIKKGKEKLKKSDDVKKEPIGSEGIPCYDNSSSISVVLKNGNIEYYNNVDDMVADAGDQLLHLYENGKQVAFYHINDVLKASF